VLLDICRVSSKLYTWNVYLEDVERSVWEILTSTSVLQATMNEVGNAGNTLYIAREERLSESFCWASIHWWRSSGPGDNLAHMLAFFGSSGVPGADPVERI
jgi:hypothetical protein